MSRTRVPALATTVMGLALVLAGCEEDRPTTPRPPVANPSPTPSPTPTPEPTPTPAANRPPTVSVTSGGGCHPLPSRPCTVAFNATASDPDGDRIAYGWDGCAQGNNPLAVCTIARPGPVTASVLVADGQGGFARATAGAEGTNLPPVVRLSGSPPNPAPSNTTFSFIGGEPFDPEDDEPPNVLCTRASVTAVSGPCRAGLGACGGVGDAFDWDVTTLQGPGTCVVEARVADIWGAVGTHRISFQVLP
jgi:hypothetical protein